MSPTSYQTALPRDAMWPCALFQPLNKYSGLLLGCVNFILRIIFGQGINAAFLPLFMLSYSITQIKDISPTTSSREYLPGFMNLSESSSETSGVIQPSCFSKYTAVAYLARLLAINDFNGNPHTIAHSADALNAFSTRLADNVASELAASADVSKPSGPEIIIGWWVIALAIRSISSVRP